MISLVFLQGLVFLALCVQAETDCRAVLSDWYGIKCDNRMECSGNFACSVDPSAPDPCQQYDCFSDGRCPEGTQYMDFWTQNGDGSKREESKQAGFACTPEDQWPEDYFECHWESGELTIKAQVKNIQRHPTAPDARKYTLIPFAQWEEYLATNPPAVQIFDTSTCVGEENLETGKTTFEVKNGEGGCIFTNGGMQFDDLEVPYYVQSVVMGYDELAFTDPNENLQVARYGRSTTLHCRISAFDTLFVNPGADGDRDDREEIKDTNVNFSIGMYSEPTFTEPLKNGDLVDISPDAVDPRIYIQLEADVQNQDNLNMIHVKQCKYTTYANTTGEWEQDDNEYNFLVNGCMIEDPFIQYFYSQKDTRTQWSDDRIPTYAVDQFSYAVTQCKENPECKFKKIVLECSVVACRVNEFSRTDEDYQPDTSICYLSDKCDGRYTNLMRSSTRGQVTPAGEKFERSEVKNAEPFNIILYKKETNEEEPNEEDISGSLVNRISLAFITFIVLSAFL